MAAGRRWRTGRHDRGGGGEGLSACEKLLRRAHAEEDERRLCTQGTRQPSDVFGAVCGGSLQRISSHSTVVPSILTKGRATWVCHSWGALRMRLLSVSRIFL